jgi:hypothetical protein
MGTEQTHEAGHESHGDHECGSNHEAQTEKVGDFLHYSY